MNRFRLIRGFWLLALGTALVWSLPGCRGLLATAVYLIKGTSVPAEFAQFKGKRVAVMCRPLANLEFNSSTAANELAQEVGNLLQTNVKKIDVIDQQKVAEWTDETGLDDVIEAGKALNADYVLAIDLLGFQLHQGQTLYQGRANVEIKVYDIKDNGKVVFDKTPAQVVYPPNTGIASQDMSSDADFRVEYVKVLANRVGRYFYPYDWRDDMAQDAHAMR